MLATKQQWCPRSAKGTSKQNRNSPVLVDRNSSSELPLPASSVGQRYRAKQPSAAALEQSEADSTEQ